MRDKLITKGNLERAVGWIDTALQEVQERIPEAVSGTNDGTNWTSLTIGDTTKAIPQGGGGSLPSDWSQNNSNSPDYVANRTHWKEVVTGEDAGVILEGDVELTVYDSGSGGRINGYNINAQIPFGYGARLTISYGGISRTFDCFVTSMDARTSKTLVGTTIEDEVSFSFGIELSNRYGGYFFAELSNAVLQSFGIDSSTQVHVRVEWLPLLLTAMSDAVFSTALGIDQIFRDGYHDYWEAPNPEIRRLMLQAAEIEKMGAFVGEYVKAGDVLQLVVDGGEPITVVMQELSPNSFLSYAGNRNVEDSSYPDTGENWCISSSYGNISVYIRGNKPQSIELKFLSRQVTHKLDGEYQNIGMGGVQINDEDNNFLGVYAPMQDFATIVQVQSPLPSRNGNAGKVLAVNSNEDGYEWVNQSGGGGGLSNYDFTHSANTTVSGSTTTITFAADRRGSAMLTISADLGLSIACNNGSDNYIWIKNTGSAEVDVTISAVTKNSTAVSNVYVPSDGITVPAGGVCEIGVIVNSDGAFITTRNDLAL